MEEEPKTSSSNYEYYYTAGTGGTSSFAGQIAATGGTGARVRKYDGGYCTIIWYADNANGSNGGPSVGSGSYGAGGTGNYSGGHGGINSGYVSVTPGGTYSVTVGGGGGGTNGGTSGAAGYVQVEYGTGV